MEASGLSASGHHLSLLAGLCGGEGIGPGHFAETDGITLVAALQTTLDEETQGTVCRSDVFMGRQPSDQQDASSRSMRHVPEARLNLIKRFEGFSLTIYICPAGYPTLGYGHVMANEQGQVAAGITQTGATELLSKDVRIVERAVQRLILVPLTDGQFDALVSFTLNLGAWALQRSPLRRRVNRGEHETPR